MSRGIKRRLRAAQANIGELIAGYANAGSHFAKGMSREGYNGGYQDALADVLLLLNGAEPCRRPEFWRAKDTTT